MTKSCIFARLTDRNDNEESDENMHKHFVWE